MKKLKTTNETQRTIALLKIAIVIFAVLGVFIYTLLIAKIALRVMPQMSVKVSACTFTPVIGDTAAISVKDAKLKKVDIPQPEPELPYTEDELYWTARIINSENGTEYPDKRFTNMLQIYSGKVMLNRLEQNIDGAGNIYEEVHSHAYDRSGPSWDKEITPRARRNAELLLSGAPYWEILDIPKMPDNVIYQAEFTQGSGIWMQFQTSPKKKTYFCYK